jgi:hypothetical protein
VENLVIEPREHFPVLNHNVQWIYYVNISKQQGPFNNKTKFQKKNTK